VTCATDLTQTSRGCAPVAYDLVADGGTVHLAHVVTPETTDDARRALDRLEPPEAAERRVATVVHVLRSSDVAGSIERLLRRTKSDLVVLGSRARGPIARLFRGSVASAVASRARIPCAVVAGGPEGAGRIARDVLVPLALAPFEDEAVRVAYRMARPGGTVHLLHAWEFAYRAAGDEGTLLEPFHPRGEGRERHARGLRERLSRLVPAESALGVRSQVHVLEHGDPIDAIRETSERVGAELLVLATRGRSGLERSWHGSVAEQALRLGRAAIVVRVPPGDAE
jgi:nucleotide-binding universal stress UspA family protein